MVVWRPFDLSHLLIIFVGKSNPKPKHPSSPMIPAGHLQADRWEVPRDWTQSWRSRCRRRWESHPWPGAHHRYRLQSRWEQLLPPFAWLLRPRGLTFTSAKVASQLTQRSRSRLCLVPSGLDPSEPYFQGAGAAVSLDTTDATFVDVIHTDGLPFNSRLGIPHWLALVGVVRVLP